VLPAARGCVPGRELREPRIARVGLGLNEVGQEAQLWDERLCVGVPQRPSARRYRSENTRLLMTTGTTSFSGIIAPRSMKSRSDSAI